MVLGFLLGLGLRWGAGNDAIGWGGGHFSETTVTTWGWGGGGGFLGSSGGALSAHSAEPSVAPRTVIFFSKMSFSS